jgi:hypothetical protein
MHTHIEYVVYVFFPLHPTDVTVHIWLPEGDCSWLETLYSSVGSAKHYQYYTF